MNNSSLKKGITVVLLANIINLVFNLLTNFLLPKYLTVDAYAQIKSFLLYVSYIGILHLGYSDGMYLRYGGKNIKSIDQVSLISDIRTMHLFQSIVALFAIVASVLTKDAAIIACAVVIVPINMANYFRFLLQATGEFRNYAKIMNITTIASAVGVLTLLLFGFFSQYLYYLLIYVLVDVFIWIYLEILIRRSYQINGSGKASRFSIRILCENISTGFFLMLGTFSSIILTGMDRWFIKLLMDNVAFAQYSFAVSMEGLMNVVVTPVSTTLYNYFCQQREQKSVSSLRGKIILFSSAVVSCAFPAKFILEIFLQNYLESVKVIFLLFGAQLFYIVIKCVYINLYKANKMQKTYFLKLTIVIISGFLLNSILYQLLHVKEAFAIGTLLCGIEWYLLSIGDFAKSGISINETVYLGATLALYLVTGINFPAIGGFFMYALGVLLLAYLLMQNSLLECFKLIRVTITAKLSQKKGEE